MVIVTVAVVESLVELGSFPGLFDLSVRQILLGVPLAFGCYFLGTVLPTMILIYAILLPRYARLCDSFATTVIVGGLTYAAMHLVEGWSTFANPRDTVLSLLFVPLTISVQECSRVSSLSGPGTRGFTRSAITRSLRT